MCSNFTKLKEQRIQFYQTTSDLSRLWDLGYKLMYSLSGRNMKLLCSNVTQTWATKLQIRLPFHVLTSFVMRIMLWGSCLSFIFEYFANQNLILEFIWKYNVPELTKEFLKISKNKDLHDLISRHYKVTVIRVMQY